MLARSPDVLSLAGILFSAKSEVRQPLTPLPQPCHWPQHHKVDQLQLSQPQHLAALARYYSTGGARHTQVPRYHLYSRNFLVLIPPHRVQLGDWNPPKGSPRAEQS